MPRVRGFTLIELMITVAVVAILASVALPSYTDHVRKGRRADAQAFLSEVVARQQHFLLDRRAYAVGPDVTVGPAANGLGLVIPPSVDNFYTIVLTTNNTARPPTFAVTAAPKGGQAADKCATLSIDHRGTRSATGSGPCW